MTIIKPVFVFLLFVSMRGFSQPANDLCINAERLCEGITLNGTTTGATAEGSDFDFCYLANNTVWYVFTTNSIGGNVTISFTNLVFNPDPTFGQNLQAIFYQTAGDCGVTPYTPMSTCGDNSSDFSINEIVVLAPNTTYYVQVNGSKSGAINAAECDFEIEINGSAVNFPDPTVTISTTNTTICQGSDEPITTTITDCDDLLNYEWTYNGSVVYSGATADFNTIGLSGSGSLELTISCGEYCTRYATSNSIPITITPVSAEAGEDQFIGFDEQTTLIGSGTGTPTWTPASSLSSTTTLNTIASPTSTTTYYLTMENDGCFATDSVTIYVGDVLIIYTAFSPNGDNINDRWHIINSEKFPNMEVNIYDRSGQRVFSAVNYSQEEQWWDGTFKGKDLPTSSYYYVIRLNDGESKEYKGYVNIIR